MTIATKWRKGSWMQTYTGKQYWPLDPRSDDVDIIDIAHALSNLCRYTGHCSKFYSVAEHSVLVSRMVPPEFALLGLLHDATEAYVNDLARPLKRHMAAYRDVEALNWAAVSKHFFGCVMTLPDEVHGADNDILLVEQWELMPRLRTLPVRIPNVRVQGYVPVVAKAIFLDRFRHLTSEVTDMTINGSGRPDGQLTLKQMEDAALPIDAKARKAVPIITGVMDYFPLAIAAIAELSRIGNEQHNPGQPLHWDRSKSADHADCIGRHMIDRGKMDTDNVRHSTKVAWRALAMLEVELEAAKKTSPYWSWSANAWIPSSRNGFRMP